MFILKTRLEACVSNYAHGLWVVTVFLKIIYCNVLYKTSLRTYFLSLLRCKTFKNFHNEEQKLKKACEIYAEVSFPALVSQYIMYCNINMYGICEF